MTTKIEQMKALTRAQSTPALLIGLTAVELQIGDERRVAQRTREFDGLQALNLVRAQIVQVLEDRYPGAAAVVEKAYFDADDEDEIDYVAALVAAIPADAA